MRHRSSIASRSLYCAVTLDETPRGAAKMHSRADAPPISHVIDEFEAACFEGCTQSEPAMGTCYRLGRRLISHARNLQECGESLRNVENEPSVRSGHLTSRLRRWAHRVPVNHIVRFKLKAPLQATCRRQLDRRIKRNPRLVCSVTNISAGAGRVGYLGNRRSVIWRIVS